MRTLMAARIQQIDYYCDDDFRIGNGVYKHL